MIDSNIHMRFGLFLLVLLISRCSILRTDGSMSFDDGHVGMIYFKTSNRIEIIKNLVADFGDYDTTKYKYQIVWRDIEQKVWSDTLMKMKVAWTRDYGKDIESLSIAIVDYNGVIITQRNTDKVKLVKKYINEIRK